MNKIHSGSRTARETIMRKTTKEIGKDLDLFQDYVLKHDSSKAKMVNGIYTVISLYRTREKNLYNRYTWFIFESCGPCDAKGTSFVKNKERILFTTFNRIKAVEMYDKV